VITAHRRLARQFSNILTVIVPDNPQQAFEIAQTAAQIGFIAAIRDADRDTAPFPDIYIAHTADEAGLFYRGAGIIFMGKSLSHGLLLSTILAAACWYLTPIRLPSNSRSSSSIKRNCSQWRARRPRQQRFLAAPQRALSRPLRLTSRK
jgi:hypothetical protein